MVSDEKEEPSRACKPSLTGAVGEEADQNAIGEDADRRSHIGEGADSQKPSAKKRRGPHRSLKPSARKPTDSGIKPS